MRLLPVIPALALLSMPLAFAPGARAEPVAVRAEAQTLSVDCAGGDAEVGGNRNTVTFTGACRGLTLRGDANRIAIDLASGASLDIEGNGNTIRYTVSGGGREPAVRVSGSNTDLASTGITPTPAPSAEPVRLTGDNQNLQLDCTGRPVDIQGNRSRYRLSGGCNALSVHGESNMVQAELQPRAKVEIEGNGTTLTYTIQGGGDDAAVVVRGADSRAVRVARLDAGGSPSGAPTPAAPAAAPAAPQVSAPAATAAPSPVASVVPSAPLPSVPQLMHDLQAKVEANGTAVSIPADALFEGGGSLRDGAGPTLQKLAALIAQTHPSGVAITTVDPADMELARQRADAVGHWLTGPGQTAVAIQLKPQRGTPPHVEVLLLR
jgi:hypothetical protein